MANDSGHDPASDEIDDLDQGATLKGLRPGLRVFDRYLLKRQLGKGGMGVVWLAEDAKLEIEVALKFLPDAVVHDAAALDELRQETRRCLRLGHPNVVRVYDLAGDAERAAIVMEHVDGETLSRRRVEQPHRHFEAAEIAVWIRQLCEALTYAHSEARVVHRDLKPSNLMLTAKGQLKVMDFGIASSLADSMTRLSRPGAATGSITGGTLPYMSPQQLRGETPSVSDDIYSLGATIYELLTSKPPFFRGELFQQIQTVVPPTVAGRREQLEVEGAEPIPEEWEETVAACLAKDPKDRPKSAADVWARLSDSPTTESQPVPRQDTSIPLPPRRKSGVAVDWKMITTVAVMAGLVVGLGLWWALKDDGSPQKRDLVTVKESDKPSPVKPATPTAEIVDLETGVIGDAREFDLGGGEKLVMKYVPGGTFTMGSPPDEAGREEYEDQVSVTLSSHYWLGETEVTQGQWETVMGSNPSQFTGDKNLPVEQVSWEDAQAYVAKLNERGGLPAGWAWSLPTEAQWERACRAGSDTPFAIGESLSYRQANFDGNFPYGAAKTGLYLEKTAPVKNYAPNGWGLYDMHGNLREWCGDTWDGESTLPGGIDPLGASGSYCVVRGGGWSNGARFCRAAFRTGFTPSFRASLLGFRVALIVRPSDARATTKSPTSSAVGKESGSTVKPTATTTSEPDLATGVIGDSRKFDLGTGEELVMKYVPGGTFTMGTSSTDQAALITPEAGGKPENYTDETAHRVTLTSDFWIGEHEVTIRDYLRFMNGSGNFDESWVRLDDTNLSPVEKSGGTYRMRTGSGATWGDERQPMVMVSWDGATAYCAWLTERAKSDLPPGYRFTLPTEAQWERAARGGTTTMTYAGDLEILGLHNAPALDPIAWYGGNSSLAHDNGLDSSSWPDKQDSHTSAGTHPVGLKRPNAYGVHDMIGNAVEWCDDWCRVDYYTDGQIDPMGPTTGSDRVSRGGGWFSSARDCRAACRFRGSPSSRNGALGFRVALSSRPVE